MNVMMVGRLGTAFFLQVTGCLKKTQVDTDWDLRKPTVICYKGSRERGFWSPHPIIGALMESCRGDSDPHVPQGFIFLVLPYSPMEADRLRPLDSLCWAWSCL